MSRKFLDTLANAPPEAPLFRRSNDELVTAARICANARAAAARTKTADGPLFLHTRTASMFVAGLLAASLLRRELAILPHAQPDYLAQVGANTDNFLTDEGEQPTLRDEPPDAPADIEPSSLADIPLAFYTSGSTAAPKKAPKSLAQLESEAHAWVRTFSGDVDAVAGTVSHQHIYGCLFRVIAPILGGWISTDVQAFTWESFLTQLGDKTLGVTSPAHLTRIPPNLDLEGKPPLRLLSSGQALPFEAARHAASLFGAPPIEILGSTETGGVATRRSHSPDELWTPLEDVEIRKSEQGTLEVRSPFTGSSEFYPMGDRVEITSSGAFRLLARADRIAKIEGKRVSLDRVEAILTAHPDIAEARVLVASEDGRERLSAVIVPNEAGRQRLGPLGAFRYSRSLLADLTDQFEVAERPKRWRFVAALPRTSQAKIPQTALAAIFAQRSILPRLNATRTEVTPDQATIAFEMSADLPWFEGHFPGTPILPGVAQVHIAARLAEEIWAFAPHNHEVRRMKFHRVLFPGDQVELTLSRQTDPDRIRYVFQVAGAIASEGAIGGA